MSSSTGIASRGSNSTCRTADVVLVVLERLAIAMTHPVIPDSWL